MADCGVRGPAASGCTCDYHSRNQKIAEQAGYIPGQDEEEEEKKRRRRNYSNLESV